MPASISLNQLNLRRALRGPFVFTATLLAVEFLDELFFGVREAAWPLIRTELGLTYAQIGVLLSVPNLVSAIIEPLLGVLGDTWKRWVLIVAGGLVYTLAVFATAAADSFGWLLVTMVLAYPASGAFVSLAQATLMDQDPDRHEHLMARWTLAGSVGVVAGPLLLGAALVTGLGWRGLVAAIGVVFLLVTLLAWRQPRLRLNGHATHADGAPLGLRAGLRQAWQAMRQRTVLRWLVLLGFSDFTYDLLAGFLALYFVDVVGVTPVAAGTAVAVWTGVGLIGDVLLIPLLERVRGLDYLRVSALVTAVLFPAFLLAPGFGPKVGVLALLGLGNAGWYAILQGRLYSALPGRSGTAMAVNSVFGLVLGGLPALFGLVAHNFGLTATLWLLLVGPIAVFVGLPRVTAAPVEQSGGD